MNISTSLHPHALDRIGYSTTIPTSALAAGGSEERLPFTVRLVRNEQDLKKAVDIRHAAYARHMPSVAETLKEPEALDLDVAAAVLLAESKLDGSPIGTIRIQSNRFRPLALEQAIEVPDWLKGKTMAHVSRLGVAQGLSGRLVKTMLIKASFQYCENNGIDWAIVAARSPLDRQYAALMFEDIFPGAGYTPLPHMNNVPHRVMGFEIASGKSRWAAAQHPLLDFFCNTYHPDIDVFDDQGHPASLSFDQSRTQQAVRVQ